MLKPDGADEYFKALSICMVSTHLLILEEYFTKETLPGELSLHLVGTGLKLSLL